VRAPTFWLNGGFMGVTAVPPAGTAFLAEDLEGTVGVLRYKGVLSLAVNGVIVAQDTRADLWDLLLKAHLPMLLHEQPERVALVGLGAGVSAGAVLAYDEVARVDCAEIAAQVVPAHKLFGAVNGRCWEDPRLRVVINDGRHVLATSTERYQVISVDPTDPPVVYQYSRDFFQVCHDKLEPGGLMVQWLPLFHLSVEHLRIVMQAFARVFPETSVWYDGTSVLLVGSRDRPLAVDAGRLRSRLARPRVQANLEPIGKPDAELVLATYVCGAEGLRRQLGPDVPDNSDDQPYLESTILMSGRLASASLADNLQLLLDAYEVEGPAPSPAQRDKRQLMRALLAARIELLREGDAKLAERAREIITRHKVTEQQWAALDVFLL
jgi:spermidine synthase